MESNTKKTEFVDKIADGARDIADSVVRATGELVEKGKKSLELSKLKAERRDTLVTLGEVAYNLEKGFGSELAKEDIVLKLDELMQRINDIESQRQAERRQQEEERERRRAERAAEVADDSVQTEQCASCGQDRWGTTPYCAYCGAKF